VRILRLLLLFLLVCGAAVTGAGLLAPGPASAASSTSSVRYNRFDVDITVDASGNFRVTEKQDVAFLSGTFQRASRNIGLVNTTDIRDVTVSEGTQAYRTAQSTGTAGTEPPVQPVLHHCRRPADQS
jgi:hypothetical protein